MVEDVTALFPLIDSQYKRPHYGPNDVKDSAIHHSVRPAMPVTATREEEIAEIRSTYVFHTGPSRLYGGIAYHFEVFPSGRAYLTVPLDRWGANVGGENDHLHGIVAAGTFMTTAPGKLQQDGVAEAIRYQWDYLKRETDIKPHRFWTATACPGNTWNQWVPGLEQKARELEDDMALDKIKDWETFKDMAERFWKAGRVPALDGSGNELGVNSPGRWDGVGLETRGASTKHAADGDKHSAGEAHKHDIPAGETSES